MVIFFTKQKPTVAVGATNATGKVEKAIQRQNSGNRKLHDPEFYHIVIVVDDERNDIYIKDGKTLRESSEIFDAVKILARAVISEYRSRYERILPRIIISLFNTDNEIMMNYVQHKGQKWGHLQDLTPILLK